MTPQMRVLYSRERISAEVERLAARITADYSGCDLHLIVVLKGAFLFAADLVRHLSLPLTIDFVQLSSYRGTESSGSVTCMRELTQKLSGRHVLVVEDIVDSGLTLAWFLRSLQQQGAASLRVCTLLNKRDNRQIPLEPEYSGIECRGGFLIGYGLDLDEQYRQLPDIYELSR
jgi:hypoxanthine phosphoribosyltransferase